jgi:DNA repair protein SbcD/Mre11
MRLLHTGDWHVGKSLRGRDRLDEQAAVLEELVAAADASDVGLVLVAGDLFDVASPPPEAERLVYRTLLDLAAGGRQVVVVAGNHDGPGRLAAVAPFAARADVTVVGGVRPPAEGGVLHLEVGGEAVRLALLPWLSPRYVIDAAALLHLDADQHQQAFAARVAQVVGALCGGFEARTVNLLLGHLHAAGGTLGGGERLAHTVLDYAVSAVAFPAACQYVGLGHLHRRQRIDGPCPVWYSGSPLALDFGETDDLKGALLVDVAAGRPAVVEPVPLRAGRRLRTLAGSMADLRALAGTTGADLLRIVVEEPGRAGLADEVRDLFPEALDVRLGGAPHRAGPAPGGGSGAGAPGGPGGGGGGGIPGVESGGGAERSGRSPQELFAGYLAERHVQDPRLERLFAELLEQATALPPDAAAAPDRTVAPAPSSTSSEPDAS